MKLNIHKKEIPSKNYYIVLLVSVLIIVLTLYMRSFYLNYKNNKINSIFYDKAISQIHESDFDFALSETTEAIMYIGITNSSKVKKMEKSLYKLIEEKNLEDKILYFDVTELSEGKYINLLKNKFSDISIQIGKAPMLIYIKDGEAKEVINSINGIIDENMLNSLLLKYGIE